MECLEKGDDACDEEKRMLVKNVKDWGLKVRDYSLFCCPCSSPSTGTNCSVGKKRAGELLKRETVSWDCADRNISDTSTPSKDLPKSPPARHLREEIGHGDVAQTHLTICAITALKSQTKLSDLSFDWNGPNQLTLTLLCSSCALILILIYTSAKSGFFFPLRCDLFLFCFTL